MNDSSSTLAVQLQRRRFVCAEFMYRPRPLDPRARRVFDFALTSRLAELNRYPESAVVLICDSPATRASLADLLASFPKVTVFSALVNPEPLAPAPNDPDSETPAHCEWLDPNGWRRYAQTDRWARITFALDLARQLESPGYLIMPAHDAVWGRDLLSTLVRFGEQYAQNGLPAAVSPYTSHQHSAVPGADIPPAIIDALNAAFARDSWLRWRIQSGRYQSFWGKMGIIPFAMSGEILRRVETFVWEDDLEIDRAICEAGYAVRCRWITDPALYRQALPVFDRAGLRAVVERTLHYSLNIPGDTSLLQRPLDRVGRLHTLISPRFARAVALSEAIIAESSAEIADRIQHFGVSWLDWGAYRHVVRVGDPRVQVWKYQGSML